MKFSDIYGLGPVKERLLRAAESGRVSHAYLFEGIRGVGKMTAAQAFASALVCEHPKDGESCGVCHGCVMCGAGSHPDVRVVENSLYGIEKKTDILAVETIRAMIKEIYLKPYIADRKIYIIPNADTMTEQAQNSLLKILEEPPAYCVLILLCENSGALLPTVLSRVVKLVFPPLSADDTADCLIKKFGVDAPRAALFARMSGGSVGRAAELFGDEDFLKTRDELADYFLRLVSERGSVAMYDFSKYLKGAKSRSDKIFEITETLLRDIMLICHGETPAKAANADRAELLADLCEKITPRISIEFIEILDKYRSFADQKDRKSVV